MGKLDAIEVVLAFHLKGDTPSEVVDVLEYMIHQDKRNPVDEFDPPFKLPDHPFFSRGSLSSRMASIYQHGSRNVCKYPACGHVSI